MSDVLSVIVVAFKSNQVLADCLRSVEKYNDIGRQLEVIVVDNCPNGSDAFAVISAEFPWVRVIENARNGGFGQGNNLGAQIAAGQYLLFLNPDTVLIEPIFDYAVGQFERDPRLGVFGMLLYDGHGRVCNNSFGIMPEHKRLMPPMAWLPMVKYLNFTPQHIFPLGADLFIRKETFERAGCFDEGMFLCYEEPDLVRRIAADQRVRIFNKKILHLEGHTTESIGIENRIKWALESEQYYFRKHKLDYRKYSFYALASLRLKKLVFFLLRRVSRHADTLLFKHYSGVLNDVVSK